MNNQLRVALDKLASLASASNMTICVTLRPDYETEIEAYNDDSTVSIRGLDRGCIARQFETVLKATAEPGDDNRPALEEDNICGYKKPMETTNHYIECPACKSLGAVSSADTWRCPACGCHGVWI